MTYFSCKVFPKITKYLFKGILYDVLIEIPRDILLELNQLMALNDEFVTVSIT